MGPAEAGRKFTAPNEHCRFGGKMIPNAEIEERLRRVSNQNRGSPFGKEFYAREMRMIAEKADMEGRSNKWMGREGILWVHEVADKPVPVLSWLKRWATMWRAP